MLRLAGSDEQGSGTRKWIANIAPMACPGAFHPKVLLLLGQKKGLLAVGSHNLTLPGFGLNIEVTNAIKYSPQHTENIGLFGAAFQAFRDWVSDYGGKLPPAISEILEQTLNLCPWLKGAAKESAQATFLYSSRSTLGLWDQASKLLPERFTEVTALAPFLDGNLSFLKKLAERSNTKPVVGIQQERVKAPDSLLTDDSFRTVDLDQFPQEGSSKRYTHAKVLALSGDNASYLISGSANLTSPAWMAESGARNAEAILFLSDDAARIAIETLNLKAVRQALPATEIATPFEFSDVGSEGGAVRTHIVLYPDGDWLLLPLDISGPDIAAYYKGALGARHELKISSTSGICRVASNELRAGAVLHVDVGQTPTARIIVHHTVTLREQTLSGDQQRFKVALGSLHTDSPDMTTFFSCLDKLMKQNTSNFSELPTSKRHAQDQPGEQEEVTSLIVDQNEAKHGHAPSCPLRRAAKGDLALLLDVLVHSASQGAIGDESAAWGVDEKGRTEEDLVDSDDAHPADNFASTSDNDDRVIALKDYCQKRSQVLVQRLSNNMEDVTRQDDVKPTDIAMSLVIAGVFRQLHRYKVDQTDTVTSLIDQNTIKTLTSLLFHQVLWEAHSPDGNSEATNCEEYDRLLAYATWLAYVSDLNFQTRLPISASQDEQDQVHWQNAVMTFLSQRLVSSPQLETEADRLLADYGKRASDWLMRMLRFGRNIRDEKQVELHDYRLALTHEKGFWGIRLVIGEEGGCINLASINRGGYSRYQSTFIERL